MSLQSQVKERGYDMTHQQRLEYQREYNRTHKEQRKAYYEKNKEKYHAYCRRYYRKNKWLWEDFYNIKAITKEGK